MASIFVAKAYKERKYYLSYVDLKKQKNKGFSS